VFYSTHDTVLFCCACQGFDGDPSIDVMLLKPQLFTATGTTQRHEQSFQYAYRQHHPLLHFLPLKLADWVAKNLAHELRLPQPSDASSSADMNHVITSCLVSDRRDNNLHIFHCVEFESDLYQGIMRERCYPFNMAQHRFRGRNFKVSKLILY
jgi:hypothetical protein